MAAVASHGRGGAGNLSASSDLPPLTVQDLQTPRLKSAIITTGRGGSGNMARNDDAYETRLMQDVEAAPRRSSSSSHHGGRGGAGNVFRDVDADHAAKAHEHAVDDSSSRRSLETPLGLAQKGKEWLLRKK